MKTQQDKTKSEGQLQSYARYSSLAFQMLFIILAGVFGGRWLDGYTRWDVPVFTVVLSLISVVLSIYYAVKDLLKKP